ncbi:MAG: radical SAM protein [Bacteroidota bacterium]|nr:radical SAM protein [Bacteroidota bacterium]
MSLKHYTIPIFIPHYGCKNDCIFCNQKKISGVKLPTSINEVENIIQAHLKTIKKENSFIEIGFFGGSFTGLSIEIQESYLKVANKYILSGDVNCLRLSTRPDYINIQILDLLKAYGVRTIELGVQSVDDEILRIAKRGHSIKDIEFASSLIKENRFNLGLQMMIGLPGDSYSKSLYTASKIVELKADCVRIYPVLVIKDTELEELYNKGIYKPLSLAEAIEIAKDILLLFESAGIEIIKVGLHPSEELKSDKALVAGPYHVSFRELVLTEIWGEILKKYMVDYRNKNINVFVSKEQINFAVGYNSKNKKKLSEYYKKVYFKLDSNLKGRELYVDIY